jgi:hypothetical protein
VLQRDPEAGCHEKSRGTSAELKIQSTISLAPPSGLLIRIVRDA